MPTASKNLPISTIQIPLNCPSIVFFASKPITFNSILISEKLHYSRHPRNRILLHHCPVSIVSSIPCRRFHFHQSQHGHDLDLRYCIDGFINSLVSLYTRHRSNKVRHTLKCVVFKTMPNASHSSNSMYRTHR